MPPIVEEKRLRLVTPSLRSGWRRFAREILAALAVMAPSGDSSPVAAEETSRSIVRDSEGRAEAAPATWLIAIGVNEYRHAAPLAFPAKDVELIASILTAHGGAPQRAGDKLSKIRRSRQILWMTDTSSAEKKPTLGNIYRLVPEFLKQVGPRDRVIFYFSGHGFLGARREAFLAPSDCDPDHLAMTGLPIGWVRTMLENCPSQTRFLFLDACHAGGTGGAAGLTGGDVEKELGAAGGVFAIVSCTAGQPSYEWHERGHGLFTYWLAQGLGGAADANGDARIDFDELSSFVSEYVPYTAETLGTGYRQTPLKIAGAADRANPPVLRLNVEDFGTTLARMAEIFDVALRKNAMRRVGVVEFVDRVGEKLHRGGALGTFGPAAAQRLEEQLAARANRRYEVLRDAARDDLLQSVNLPADGQLKNVTLAADAPAPEALVVGCFQRLAEPWRLLLHCQLLVPGRSDVLASVTGTIQPSLAIMPYFPVSADLSSAAPGTASPQEALLAPLIAEHRVQHPLLAPGPETAPFVVKFLKAPPDGELREVRLMADPSDANRAFFRVRPRDRYAIRLKNRGAATLAVRVFIDGLNVIGACREAPSQARPWIFRPGAELTISSWHRPSDGESGVAEFRGGQFVVTTPADSLAGAAGFDEEIGQITIAAYHADDSGRHAQAVGTGEGRQEVKQYRPIEGIRINNEDPCFLYTVRYVSETGGRED
ncbi:MAG: caspase family protein [Pirellulales bacterium]|nr:caspase family protein [Pirellulales bacterium]